jgi:hypothetical protein
MALESYCTDEQHYPASYAWGWTLDPWIVDRSLYALTTPVQYVTSVSMRDPFTTQAQRMYERIGYSYYNYEPIDSMEHGDYAALFLNTLGMEMSHRCFSLWSAGPDKWNSDLFNTEFGCGPGGIRAGDVLPGYIDLVYDMTNGTKSRGDLMRRGGDIWMKNLPLLDRV